MADSKCSESPSVDTQSVYRKALENPVLAELNSSSSSQDLRGILSGGRPNFPANFPPEKRIPGTRFIVDGFRSAGPHSIAYFLSHFHSDHYTGITSLWNKGLIFCSEITASLVLHSLKVHDSLVISLPIGESISIDGVDVTLVDANHCPGAVQFLFRVPEEGGDMFRRYVHTGDMRYAPSMKADTSLCDFVGADAVFLDTTYCNPKFVFPSQKESVNYVADTVYRLTQGDEGEGMDCEVTEIDNNIAECDLNFSTLEAEDHAENRAEFDQEMNPGKYEGSRVLRTGRVTDGDAASEDVCVRDISTGARQQRLESERVEGTAPNSISTLFLISTYVIGKEKILTAVANRCGCLLHVDERKLLILKCLNLEDVGIFTTDPAASNVHIVGWSFLGETWPYFRPNFSNMEKLLTETGYRRVVGFVPTGWMYELKKRSFSVRRKGPCEIHLVPYSEHSNYDELREFVAFLRPKEIIPTVGLEGGGMDGKAAAAMRKHFRNLVDETASKRKFLKGFNRRIIDGTDSPKTMQSDSKNVSLELEKHNPTGAKEEPTEGIETKEGMKAENPRFELPPRAAFGRGARKRRRETDRPSAEAGEAGDIYSQATETGANVCIEQKVQGSGRDENDHICADSMNAQSSTLGASQRGAKVSSNPLELGLRHGNHGTTGGVEEGQLRSILPDWVRQDQIERLLADSKGDVNAALAEFYDQNSEVRNGSIEQGGGMGLGDNSIATSEGRVRVEKESEGLPGISVSLKQGLVEGISQSPKVQSTEGNKLGLTRLSTSQPIPSPKKSASKGSSRSSTPNSKSRPHNTSKAGRGKSKGTAATPLKRKGQGLQPTILTFFQRARPELSQTIEELAGNDGEISEVIGTTETAIFGFDSTGLSGLEEDSQADQRLKTNILTKQKSCAGSDDMPQSVDITELVESLTPARLLVNNGHEWGDEIQQLLSILDGEIAEEGAKQLLQKANGDVGRAIDLYYSVRADSAGILVSKSVVSSSKVGFIEPIEAHGATSKAEESIFQLANKEEHSGDTLPIAPAISAECMVTPSQLSKATISEPKVSSITEKKMGSIGMPIGKYNPIEHACWRVGEAAPYIHLARTFDLVERESGRLKTSDMLCNMFRSLLALSPEDVLPAIYLATNRIAPDFENTDLNIGGSTVAAAISEATGTPRPKLRDMYNHMGDLGRLLFIFQFESCIELQKGRGVGNFLVLAWKLSDILEPLNVGPNRIDSKMDGLENIFGYRSTTQHIVQFMVSDMEILRFKGDVAQACRQNQSMLRTPSPLRIRQVFSALHQISKESGNGSAARKKGLILGLLRACRENETKYLIRTLVQNMRIGAMMRTVLPALAQAVVFHRSLPFDQPAEKAHEHLKAKLQEASTATVEAYNFLPNLDMLVPTLINRGVEALTASVSVSCGTPIKSMLAKITNGIPEVLKRFQGIAFTCEYKYDGQRAQIHMQPDGSFRIFSRNCEDTTSRFPDVAEIVRSSMQPLTKSFIIDAEVVAIDRENGNKLMAFQHLSTRERGTRDGAPIHVQNIKVDVCVFVFDLMLANGEPLVKLPFRERRNRMRELFPNVRPGYFGYASEITVEAAYAQPDSSPTSQRLEAFLDEAFAASCEGLMAKALDNDATYAASKRSDSWLKVKKDYVEGLHDTLDLVPIGAWHGNGRKAGWYSPFLLACYDPVREEYQSVCRVMSGFTDTFYRETKEFYSGQRTLPRKPPYYQTGEEPDVWFSAEVVWEIRGADLTISPVHQAGVGLVHPSRGISMRFPRLSLCALTRNLKMQARL